MLYNIVRNGKCLSCGQLSSMFIAEAEAKNSEEAIDIAKSHWINEKYGDAGSLREEEIREEDEFLQGDFVAEKVN
jgi:hypothetical protein